MSGININKYLEDMEFLENAIREIELFSLDNLEIINNLASFISVNRDYSDYSGFLEIADLLVDFIEKFNGGDVKEEDFAIFANNIKLPLESFFNNLKKKVKLKVYFYGKDSFGIIENKLLKYDVRKIVSEKEVKLLSLNKKNSEQDYNILFSDRDFGFRNTFFNEIISYNQIASAVKNATIMLYRGNYDFNYLDSALKKSSERDVESIIVGNSYPLVGIDEELLKRNTVKLAMSSQDLYYSFELAKKAINSNENIKQCIFGISYYILNHDLSRGKSEYSRGMIQNVYKPLLNDVHNAEMIEDIVHKKLRDLGVDILIRSIFDMDKIEEYFKEQIYKENGRYYNDINVRKKGNMFKDKDDSFKKAIGMQRAEQHNKLFNYEGTEKEYRALLEDFIKFTNDNGIDLVFVVLPTTAYYYDGLKDEYVESFNKLIEELNKRNGVRVLDLRTVKEVFFDDLDFVDTDHLNERGELKATEYVNKFL